MPSHGSFVLSDFLEEIQDQRCNKGLNYSCHEKERHNPAEIKSHPSFKFFFNFSVSAYKGRENLEP